jgi:hypothetical protein
MRFPSPIIKWRGTPRLGPLHRTKMMQRVAVTTRETVWLFAEQLCTEFVPVFHRLQGRPLGQCCLRKLLIVEHDIAQNGLLKILAVLEPMALQDVFDPAIESLDHAICLRSHWWCETLLEAEISAKLVELMQGIRQEDLDATLAQAAEDIPAAVASTCCF